MLTPACYWQDVKTHKAEAKQLVHIATQLTSNGIRRHTIHKAIAYQARPPPEGPAPCIGKRKSKKQKTFFAGKKQVPLFGRQLHNVAEFALLTPLEPSLWLMHHLV